MQVLPSRQAMGFKTYWGVMLQGTSIFLFYGANGALAVNSDLKTNIEYMETIRVGLTAFLVGPYGMGVNAHQVSGERALGAA